MTDDRDLLIPRRLDDPPKFLFWDFDVALLFMSGAFFGILSNYMLVGMALGGVMAWAYGRMKSGKQKGYLMHLAYWYMPAGFALRRVPKSAKRVFYG